MKPGFIEYLNSVLKSYSNTASTPKKSDYAKVDYLACYDPQVLEHILVMYIRGMAIADIYTYTFIHPEEINNILDHFAPYLG